MKTKGNLLQAHIAAERSWPARRMLTRHNPAKYRNLYGPPSQAVTPECRRNRDPKPGPQTGTPMTRPFLIWNPALTDDTEGLRLDAPDPESAALAFADRDLDAFYEQAHELLVAELRFDGAPPLRTRFIDVHYVTVQGDDDGLRVTRLQRAG